MTIVLGMDKIEPYDRQGKTEKKYIYIYITVRSNPEWKVRGNAGMAKHGLKRKIYKK